MGIEIERFPSTVFDIENHELNTKRQFILNRKLESRGSVTLASGSGFGTFFRQPYTRTWDRVGIRTRGTAAGATPTLIKYALFSVDIDWPAGTWTATQQAVTSNVNATSLASTFTSYLTALSANLIGGNIYCAFMLVVTGATAPIVYGHDQGVAGETLNMFPPVNVKITSLTDVPASFTNATANLTNTTNEMPFVWFENA